MSEGGGGARLELEFERDFLILRRGSRDDLFLVVVSFARRSDLDFEGEFGLLVLRRLEVVASTEELARESRRGGGRVERDLTSFLLLRSFDLTRVPNVALLKVVRVVGVT